MTRRIPIRVRLAAWWAVTVLVVGVIVISYSFTTASRQLDTFRSTLREDVLAQLPADDGLGGGGGRLLQLAPTTLADVLDRTSGNTLDRIRTDAQIGLVVLAVGSAILGYAVAGRMLRPVSELTDTARRLSTDRLGDRIEVSGPDDELTDLAEAFNQMLARLEHAFTVQQTFAANASHELRTPLQLILTEVDVGLEPPRDAETAETVSAIRAALVRAEDVIEALLVLSRTERVLHAETTDLAHLVAQSLQDHEVAIHDLGLSIDTDLAPAPVEADATLSVLLVDNLVANAVRHNVPGGVLHVRTGPGLLEVANDGPLLTREEVGRLGERFYRPDPSRTRAAGGSGLGLSIVTMVADAHDADLRILARDGGGLQVTVRFDPPQL